MEQPSCYGSEEEDQGRSQNFHLNQAEINSPFVID